MRSPRVWLVLLVITLVGEFVWGLLEWVRFLARRKACKEDMSVLLIGDAAKGKSCRIVCAFVLGIVLVVAGCSSSAARTDDRPPVMTIEDLSFHKAEETMVDLLTPVYGASSPPWDTLNETLLDADPESGRMILENIAELLVP